MKHVVCLFVSLCACQVTSAQAAKSLPDDFARSAFRVLKMVEGEAGRRVVSAGQQLVPRETSQAINDLDADASSKEEQNVLVDLRTAFDAKLDHNQTMRILTLLVHADLIQRDVNSGPADVAESVQKRPTAVEIHQKESACFDALEQALRARSYQPVPSCDRDALHVATPEQ